MRSRWAILIAGLLVAQPAAALECDPWPVGRSPRLIVRTEASGELRIRFRGRVSTASGHPVQNASISIVAGRLGSVSLVDEERGLAVKRRRR